MIYIGASSLKRFPNAYIPLLQMRAAFVIYIGSNTLKRLPNAYLSLTITYLSSISDLYRGK